VREISHAHRAARLALAAGLAFTTTAPPGAALGAREDGLPPCAGPSRAVAVPRSGAPAWEAVLDEDGVLVGHELRLVTPSGTIALALGPRAFVSDHVGGRVVLGERSEGSTHLTVIDTLAGCAVDAFDLHREVYDARLEHAGRSLRFVAVEPGTRAFVGTFRVRLDSPAEAEDIGEPCQAACEPGDDALDPAVLLEPAGSQPVPVYPGARWAGNTSLTFRWEPGQAPPSWARPAIRAAADAASRSRRSRAPTYAYDSSATDSVRYTSAFPDICRYGIACASRNLPAWWTVRLRPHGTDFSWGRLRWCQKEDASGCFDIERTMLHEFGHVSGLGHPESSGFRLPASDTVMHAVIPAKPKAGSGMRAFGPCDVASLQRVYDVPGPATRISTCLALATRLSLKASLSAVNPDDSVRLRAKLSIAEDAAYGQLSGDPLRGRSVLLRYRPAGSEQSWSTVWMQDGNTAGAYLATISVPRTLEFQAVFRSPEDEGLRRSTSAVVTVRVIACGTSCPSGGDEED
jgi:hypothetical protein